MASSFNLTARINLQGPYNLRPIISKIKSDLGSIKPELKFKLDPSAAQSVSKVTSELKKLNTAAKNANSSVGSLNAQLQQMAQAFSTVSSASGAASQATSNVSKSAAAAAKAANQARTAMEEFGKQSGLAIKRFAAFSSVTTVIYGLTSAINSAYQEFLLFNKELVRLSQVTNKSVSELGGISGEITKLSTSLGVASSDLITVASTLAQAGLSAEDTKIALEALAKSSLAPSFDDITQTTEGAIAAIRQFGLQTKELDSALGSINAVAAAFAVESKDIIAAIQRTGGVFSSASRGVSEGTDSLNEFIAIFTSVRQTTRESAETIATGLRTIFTRIQRASTIDLLKQYGVELRDLEGKFVGPYEAVKRLSEGLSRIDPRSADFARISEELGGFRQIGKVIPLIQQFSVAQQALNIAQKGSGSLTKDAEAAQQSLAVQFAKTRENFIALVRDIASSQSFKVFVNTTLTLTNALISLGQALKPLLPLLLTFTAIKIGSSVSQFASGFGLAFNRGTGGGGTAGGPTTPSGGGGGGGSGGNQPLTAALSLNTTATNTLNQSILALNQNIVNTNSLLMNRPTKGFATGGLVPGSGNRDTVPAVLTPGEFVIRKKAVEAIGSHNLHQMNKYATGGPIKKYARGGYSNTILVDDIRTNSNRAMLPNKIALERIVKSGGYAALDFDRTLKRTIGDQAYARAKTPTEQNAVLSRYFRDPQTRLGDAVSAPLTQFGQGLLDRIKQGLVDPSTLSIVSKSKRVPGLAEHLHELFGIPLANMIFTGGASKEPAVDAIRTKGPRSSRLADGGFVQKFADGGIVRQNTIAAAVLKDATVDNKKLDSKKAILKLVGSYLDDKEKSELPDNYTLVREGIDPAFKDNFMNALHTGLIHGVESSIASITKSLGLPGASIETSQENIQNFLQSINDASLGNLFEDTLSTIEKSGRFDTAENPRRPFDFTDGLNSAVAQRLFPRIASSAIQYVDAKASMEAASPGDNGSKPSGMLNKIIEQIKLEHPSGPIFGATPPATSTVPTDARQAVVQKLQKSPGLAFSATDLSTDKSLRSFKGQINKTLLDDMVAERLIKKQSNRYILAATGGSIPSISSQDTVPALLTPGEFVINKQAAQRLGGATLHRLNNADKIRGFNQGGSVGIVQRFGIGGAAESLGTAGVMALIGSLLMPQIQQLANGLSKLNGSFGELGTVISGVVRESSSLVLSSSIALEAVGIKGKAKGIGIGLAGIGGAIGGGLTDLTTRKLEEALQKNNNALNTFNKSLDDLANAPTEELKLEAAAKLERNFITLDNTVRKNIGSIEQFEKLKMAGESIGRFTQTTLLGVVALQSLILATKAQAATQAANAAANAVQTTGKAAGAVAAISMISSKLGAWGLTISGLITVLSAGFEMWTYANQTIKNTADQFSKLNKSLEETTKNSNDFSIANKTFTSAILPEYSRSAQLARETGDKTALNQQLSDFTDLNLLFRTQLKSSLASRAISIQPNQTLQQARASLTPNQQAVFDSVFKDVAEMFKNSEEKYIAAVVRSGGSETDAKTTYNTLKDTGSGKAIIQKVIAEYVAQFNKEIAAARELELAMRSAKIPIVTLSNTLSLASASISKSADRVSNSLEDLDKVLALTNGESSTVGGDLFKRSAQTLDNLLGSSISEIASLKGVAANLFGKNPQTASQLSQLQNTIDAQRVINQQMPTILTYINSAKKPELTGDFVKKGLQDQLSLVLPPDAVDPIINQISASIETALRSSDKGSVSLDEMLKNDSKFAELMNLNDEALKKFKDSLEKMSSLFDKFGETQKKAIEIQQTIMELNLQEVQLRQKSFVDLQEALGNQVDIRTKNYFGLQEFRSLTGGAYNADNNGIRAISARLQALTGSYGNQGSIMTPRGLIEVAKERLSTLLANGADETTVKAQESSIRQLNIESMNLSKVMKMMAQDGTLASNALTEIGKQKDLLKSQDQLMFELLRDAGDPVKAFELERTMQAITAVRTAISQNNPSLATRDQYLLAGEKGVSYLRGANGEEAAQKFFSSMMRLFAGSVDTRNNPAARKGQVDFLTKEQTTLNPLIALFNWAVGLRKTALEEQGKIQAGNLEKANGTLITQTNNLTSAFLSLQQAVELQSNIEKTMNAVEMTSLATAPVMNAIPEPIDALLSRLAQVKVFDRGRAADSKGYGKTKTFDTGGFISKDELTTLRQSFSLANNSIEQFRILEEAINKLVSRPSAESLKQVTSTPGIGAGAASYGSKGYFPSLLYVMGNYGFDPKTGTGALEQYQPVLLELSKLVGEELRKAREASQQLQVPPENKPKTPTDDKTVRPKLSSGMTPEAIRSMQQFSTSTTALAQALTGDNKNITNLSTAVNNLTPIANDLKTAVTTLATLFKDGKIQLESTSTAKVDVKFDSPLSVDNVNKMDKESISQIEQYVSNTISSQITKLKSAMGLT